MTRQNAEQKIVNENFTNLKRPVLCITHCAYCVEKAILLSCIKIAHVLVLLYVVALLQIKRSDKDNLGIIIHTLS